MAGNESSFQNALEYSPAQARFSKLTKLLIGGGTIVFRELFDHIYPPETLVEKLSDTNGEEYKILQRMRRNNLLYKNERELLFPTTGPGSVTSKFFDITLLYKLFADFCDLFLETNRLPKIFSEELLANLKKIKDYRNEVYAHVNIMEISKEEFEKLWKEIKDVLLEIVKCYDPEITSEYERAIDNLYKAPIKGYPDVVVRCSIKVVATKKTIEGSESFQKRLFKDKSNFAKVLDLQNVFPEGVVLVDVKGRTSTDLVLWAVELSPLDEFWERYEKGELKEALKKIFTKRVQKMAKDENLELVSFDVTVEKRDYEEARNYLLSTSFSGEKLSEIWRIDNCVSDKEASVEEKTTSPIIAIAADPIYLTSVSEEPKPVQPDDESLKIKHGEPLEDRGSKYQAYLIEINNRKDIPKALRQLGLGDNTGSTKPKLQMWGCRINRSGKKSYIEKYGNGSEFKGGQRILEILREHNVGNTMVVVTCSQGGIPLGKDRFKNYRSCIEKLVREHIKEGESRNGKHGGTKEGTSRVSKRSVAKSGPSKIKGKKNERKTASKKKDK